MKRNAQEYLICAAVLLGLAAASAGARTWTSVSGATIEAELVESKPDRVILKKEDGELVTIRKTQLSKADIRYLQQGTKHELKGGKKGVSDFVPAKPAGEGFAVSKPAAPAGEVPVLKKGFVGNPDFDTAEGPFSAGTAFAIKLDNAPNPIILTAQHLFGEAGGLKKQLKNEDLPKFVRKVGLTDFVGGKAISPVKADALPITAAGGEGENEKAIDLAAFRLPADAKFNPSVLAAKNPEVKDVIWLVASLQDDGKELLHRGIVREVGTTRFTCQFDKVVASLRGASGAPYLNAKGEVVGLHVGSIKELGNISGAAITVETLRLALGEKPPEAKPADPPVLKVGE